MKMVALRPCDDLKDKAQAEATTLLSAYPNLKLIMAICSPAVPGAAEAITQAGKRGTVKLIGLGLPSENKKYVLGRRHRCSDSLENHRPRLSHSRSGRCPRARSTQTRRHQIRYRRKLGQHSSPRRQLDPRPAVHLRQNRTSPTSTSNASTNSKSCQEPASFWLPLFFRRPGSHLNPSA